MQIEETFLAVIYGISTSALGFFLKATYSRITKIEEATNVGLNQLNIQIAKLNENFRFLNEEKQRYEKLEERIRELERIRNHN